MRVKSPFSHSALFGLTAGVPKSAIDRNSNENGVG
jgi:hypothetical protein